MAKAKKMLQHLSGRTPDQTPSMIHAGGRLLKSSTLASAALALLVGAVGLSSGQATITLKAKLRDFKEANSKAGFNTNTHPDFETMNSCGDVGYVLPDIATDRPAGDSTVFAFDNRSPVKSDKMAKTAGNVTCFTSKDRFEEWYNDKDSSINRAFLMDLVFTRNATTGMYEYINGNFFPLDNGAPFTKIKPTDPGTFGHLASAAHNFGFTMEFHTTFTYLKGTSQTFEFTGDDDVYAFINGKQIIDLGGRHGQQTSAVNLDTEAARLGLLDSTDYILDFFFAERHTAASNCKITTSLVFEKPLGKPALNPTSRPFEGQIAVSVLNPTAGVTYCYTTDGSEPTAATCKPMPDSLVISVTTTLKVIATRPGWITSPPAIETYTQMQQLAKPTANPSGKIFVEPIQVSILHIDPAATIRFTTDGTEPTATSPIYTGPITVSVTTTVKAKAFRENWVASETLTEVYTDANTLPPPVADPKGQGFITSQVVTLSVPGHADAAIHYTLDGSVPTTASPLYATGILLDKTTVVTAKAFKTDWKPSQVLVETYNRLSKVARAVYIDKDGNGRIDGAVIQLDIPPSRIPTSVTLTDPFSNTPSSFPSSSMSVGASPEILIVNFSEKQFQEGTIFPTADYGVFPSIEGFSPIKFPIADSVGPVPTKAYSKNKTTPEEQPTVEVTFSEPVDIKDIQANPEFPFIIYRKGVPETRPTVAVSVVPVAGKPNTFLWTFEATSPAFPVYIDSIALAPSPLVRDLNGVPGVANGKKVDVDGEKLVLINKLNIQVTNLIAGSKAKETFPTIPQNVRLDPISVVGTLPGGQVVCLDCPSGSESIILGTRPIPEWIIKAKYAFSYQFHIYDHFGQFISKTVRYQVTEKMLENLPQDINGFKAIQFRWIPVSKNNSEVATGVYILRGFVQNRKDEAQKGSQGEDQTMTSAQTAVFSRFGYVRQQ